MADEPANDAPPLEAPDSGASGGTNKKKKDKVRSAWIAFAGRIVAQILGAVASVVLGVLILQRFAGGGSGDKRAATVPPERVVPAPVRVQRPAGEIALAVLPLDNFSGDQAQEYFADGMTDALIADLAQLRGLHVISRTSVMFYKGHRKSLPEIAGELGVDYVIEGSVARAGERVRVMAQLIDARTDQHLWARTYDRTMRDVLSLQAEVAKAVADEVNVALTPRHQARLDGRSSVDPVAYDFYLKGRQAVSLRTQAGFDDAIRLFEEAIARDSTFATAHAGLADTYSLLGISLYSTVAPRGALARAKAAAERALALDDGSPQAHTSLASVRWRFEWDWAGAERAFRRALELNPSYATGHSRYATFLAEQGRPGEASEEAQRALDLDPLSATIHRAMGIVHYHARRFDAAEASERRALELEPDSVATRLVLAWTLIERGNPRGAIRVLGAVPDPARQDQVLATLAYAQGRLGDRDMASEIGRRLLVRQPPPTLAAAVRVHVALGDDGAALAALDRAITERSGSDVLTALKVDPLFDRLRPDPRFAALLARLKLS